MPILFHIPPFISDPGSLSLFLYILIFCESLALYAKYLGALYTQFWRQKLNKVLTKTHDIYYVKSLEYIMPNQPRDHVGSYSIYMYVCTVYVYTLSHVDVY